MQTTTRRWWRYNIVKKKNLSNLKNLKIVKILKLKKINQVTYNQLMNLHSLTYKLLKYRGCLPSMCFKSAKFKKLYNFGKLNRWDFLKYSNQNLMPNLKKFVW
jgi:hypothetical protein